MPPPALLLPLVLLLAGGAGACTSIIVGSAASTDGSIYIARTDDTADARSTVNNLLYHAARDGPATFRSRSFKVHLPGPGLSYMAMPVSIPQPAARDAHTATAPPGNATGETAGVNSAALAVSGTESLRNSDAALAADPYTTNGLTEDVIPSLLLPQASSAREAAQLLGSLVERLGAGEGFGVLLADPQEAWYLETASGHHWAAQRVPDGAFFVSANQGRFQEIDLGSSATLSSPGLRDFAIQAGLFRPSSPSQPLNFFQAFMADGKRDASFNYPRVCALQQLYAGSVAPDCSTAPHQPPFLPPASLLSVHDVMAGLRNHFDGSGHDAYLHQNPREPQRPIALLRTSAGHVTRLRAGVPAGLQAINYVAMGMPALSPFVPIYQGLPGSALPRELVGAGSEPDPVSLFWKARRLQALVFQDWPALAPNATAAIAVYEQGIELTQRPEFEARYAAHLAAGDTQAAGAELVGFTASVVLQAGDLLNQQAEGAARALGLPGGVPSDRQLVRWLDRAAEQYSFRYSERLRWHLQLVHSLDSALDI